MEDKKEEKIFTIELTRIQIAIIKAGLQYYWLADNYGYSLWATTPGASFGGSDHYYSHKVGEIYEKLRKLSTVKPDYGWWGDVKRISKLCKEDYKIAKKEGEKAEKTMFEEYTMFSTIEEHISKHGLDGKKIVEEACKEARAESERQEKEIEEYKKSRKRREEEQQRNQSITKPLKEEEIDIPF